MNQKVVIVFVGADCKTYDLQDEIKRYLDDGWEIKQVTTAFVERAGVGKSIAVTLLLGK